MTKHSKNNTASSIFSYAEYKRLDYGTKRQRLGGDSMRPFDACSLCIQTARDPVACSDGHLFCKECAYTDLLAQKKDIKKQKEKLAILKREAEEEKARAKAAARERVLLEFERGQLGLASASATSTSGAEKASDGTESRGVKRKFNFDASTVDKLAEEAEEAALRQIEREQAESLRHKLPDFWLPSLTPTYSSSGPPRDLKDVKVQTTCRGGNPAHSIARQDLVPVCFARAQPSAAEKAKPEEEREAICPSCKKGLSNSTLMFLMRPCSHVVCKTCTDSLVKESKQCIVCDKALKEKDIVELKREGTGYAAGGMAETSKAGVAFQG